MTNKELLISRLNLLTEEDIASLLDAATHMEGIPWPPNRTAPIAAPIPSSVTDINAASKAGSISGTGRRRGQEPENRLHPQLLSELAEEFWAYANKGGQVFVSTHSPDYLNAVRLGAILARSSSHWKTREKEFGERQQVKECKTAQRQPA